MSDFRRDELPEHHHYRDDGCEVSASCLRCPLPVCRYDAPNGLLGLRASARKEQVLEAWSAGFTAREISARFGIAPRSVQRIIAESRRES